jgi:hypothetical protein
MRKVENPMEFMTMEKRIMDRHEISIGATRIDPLWELFIRGSTSDVVTGVSVACDWFEEVVVVMVVVVHRVEGVCGFLLLPIFEPRRFAAHGGCFIGRGQIWRSCSKASSGVCCSSQHSYTI